LATVEDGFEVGPQNAAWVADQRKWASGWRRVVFPTLFLAYLIQTAVAIPNDTPGLAGRIIASVILALFCACYAIWMPTVWMRDSRPYVLLVAAMSALCIAELPFAHADALVMGVFISAVVVVRFGEVGLLVVLAFLLVAILVPPAIPSWHDTITTGFSNGTAIAIPLAGMAMFGFGRVIRGNILLADARTELARLARENERTRIARDLHDLLGHSLTTITVKAELADKLSVHDPDAAVQEIREVALLSRRALSDVRAAVGNYRDVNLANELATGRELLRAAGIVGELPPAATVADDQTQELFGWVVREGLTNVVRHSHATYCTVRISPCTVEIVDDGVGGNTACGHGLIGLAERVSAVGGVIETGPVQPRGWRLAVTLAGAPA
jgi:two-component system, NarL family, sensor histidine kinase DesK